MDMDKTWKLSYASFQYYKNEDKKVKKYETISKQISSYKFLKLLLTKESTVTNEYARQQWRKTPKK